MVSSALCPKRLGVSVKGILKGASIPASSTTSSSLKVKYVGLLEKTSHFHQLSKHGCGPLTFAIRASSTKVHVGGVGASDKDGKIGGSGSDIASAEPTRGQKAREGFKELWKKYGTVAITTYLSVYVSTLTSVFFALDYDIFGASTFGMDPADAIHKVADIVEGVTGSAAFPEYVKENPRLGTFAVAWIMTKFTEPARLFFTIGIVPSIARTLGYAPPKAPKASRKETSDDVSA